MSTFYIDDVRVVWDFKKGNHFIDIFEVDTEGISKGLPRYSFIIHGSSPELRGENEKGIGLYYDKSRALKELCKKKETPFGTALYLDGDDAKEYYNFYLYSKKFAAEKRKKAAELLFGNYKIISNPTHQGLKNYHEILLGAQYVDDPEEKFFPIALRSDLPTYLVTGLPSLNDEIISELGFESRAKKFGVYERLTNFNILPHGGGYSIPHITRVIKVDEIDGERYYLCEQENGEALNIMTDPGETQFVYRGKKVVNRAIDLNLGKLECKMYPKFILKI
ncbi:MAG: hypothetical protein ACTSRZ_06680 [Promethearchaeota archaeon]